MWALLPEPASSTTGRPDPPIEHFQPDALFHGYELHTVFGGIVPGRGVLRAHRTHRHDRSQKTHIKQAIHSLLVHDPGVTRTAAAPAERHASMACTTCENFSCVSISR